MRLTLRQLLIFVAVADTGSTVSAGQRVALSQSATSGALNELENLLGAPLFDRVAKRLQLNDNGRALLPKARAVLDAVQHLEEEFGVGMANGVAEGLVTRLRIGASTTIGNYLLPTLVARYQRVWPAAEFDLQVANTHDIAVSVARLELDLGFIEGPCHEPELTVVPWLEDELVIVCGVAHPLSKAHNKTRLTINMLRQANWLLREPGSGTREAVEHALLPHLHHLNNAMQLGSAEAIKHAAAEGLGLACLSKYAVQDFLTMGRLVELKTTLPRLRRMFYLVHHRRKQFSDNLQRFMLHCTESALGKIHVSSKR